MKTRTVHLYMVGLSALFLHAEAALADIAGHIQFVNGDVQVTNPSGMARALHKGDAINEGDTISSAKEASAQVKMKDGGFIAVRQDTQLKFDSFKIAVKQGDPENSFFSLLKGSFRAVTGLIGRVNKQEYKITTPVATIGIRGTDHETAFVPNALPGIPAGAYSKVNIGETSLTTDAGTVNVKPNQMGFAGGMTHPPKLLPINTSLFTVAAAPAKESKVIGAEDKTEQTGTDTAGAEPIRETAVVDNTSESGSPSSTAPTTTTTVTTTETTTVAAPPQTTVPVTATNDSLVLDTTNQTVSAGGTSVSVQDGAFGVQAQAAADAALLAANAAAAAASSAATSNATIAALALDTTPAVTAISTATPTVTSASTLSISTSVVSSNATAAQTVATTAASAAAAAQAALTAHGTFADVTATPANTATQSANTVVQTANASVQSAASSVTAQSTALTTAQAAAAAALGTANTSLTTATSQGTTLTTTQTAAAAQLAAAQAAATAAQAAATAAQAAADQAALLQAQGDFTGAQTQLTEAQTQLATAQQQQQAAAAALAALSPLSTSAQTAQTSGVTSVTAAVTAATTAEAQAAAAQTAVSTANTVTTTSTADLTTVNANATTVATNAPIAAYNNPAIAGDFIGVMQLSTPVAGGFHIGFPPDNPLQPNTTYVLDGSGNLVEMRNSQFQVQTSPNGIVLTPSITGTSGADIKWSGGTTGADAFKLADNSVYMGRWQNATVTVTDNANPANVSTYTSADNIWLLLLPPPAGYVQTLAGTTTYAMAGHTTPVDAFGNLGVLNSATLTADFTNQLVTTGVNLTMGAASTMAGTYTVTGTNLPIDLGGFDISTSSSGAGTLTFSCSGTCAAGTTGYSAELGGAFGGTAAASAALGYNIWPTTTGTAPLANSVQGYVAFTSATAPAVTPAGSFAAYTATDTAVAYTGSYGGGFNFVAAPGDVTPLGSPTTFTESYGDVSGFRTDVLNGASTTTPPTTANGITFGVWENVASVSASSHYVTMPDEFGSLPHAYMYGAEGYLDSAVSPGVQTGPLVGTFSYNQVAMTSYDTNTWEIGTATSATMSANFTNQTVNVALAGTMGTTSWTSTGSNMPIDFINTSNGIGASFDDFAPAVTVNAAACTTCGGNISGAFVGQNYAGAIIQYDVWDDVGNLGVDGLVAFDRLPVTSNPAVTNGTPNPSGTFVMANNAFNVERPTGVTTNLNGVLTGWSVGSSNTTVAPAAGSTAQTAVGTGSGTINWGQWAAGSVIDWTFSYTPGTGQFHWITAPEPTPFYLAEVLAATNAVYNYVDGDVTSLSGGVHGTVNGSTSLTVNFTTQSVAANLGLTVNGHTWAASTTDAPLQYLNGDSLSGFFADSYRLPSQPGYLTVTVDAAPANGNLAGQLVGAALGGAFLKFNLDGQVATPTTGYEWVQGVAALGAAVPNDPLAPYKIALALVNDPLVMDGGGDPMVGGYQAPASVGFDGSGNLIKLSGDKAMIELSSGTTGSAFTGASSAAGTSCSPCTDVVTGIQWGRWSPGLTATVTEAGIAPEVITINGGGVHWIATPQLSGPVTLPVSGTYVYTLAGGTNPSDSTGAVGTLNSATLSANFTAQTVDVGVNATVAATTINASATSVPILKGAIFDAHSSNGLTVACTGTACSGAKGEITGGFGGAGAIGAVMAYGFLPNPAVANMITGVAAFHR